MGKKKLNDVGRALNALEARSIRPVNVATTIVQQQTPFDLLTASFFFSSLSF